MKTARLPHVFIVSFVLTACGSGNMAPGDALSDSEYAELSREVAQMAMQSPKAIPVTAKIFLVAGGSDSANFAEEIVQQRRYWLSQGFTLQDIASMLDRISSPSKTIAINTKDWHRTWRTVFLLMQV